MAAGTLHTPLGPLTVTSEDGCITGVRWGDHAAGAGAPEIDAALAQLKAYFAGELTHFDLPWRVTASDFQREVCAAMLAIPFGETRTYGELARQLSVPAQAIGGACGGNPIPVIIPCHRVLGANGLGGYSGAGGVETKVWLLRHEKAAGLLI
ncbi:methylated-DNA--[protein]-cysteine S-methyltransferase [Roseovarius faecimaris]|uniref:Methylated-DNA--protein-cysteine methyltransferase n=1 Tax=Roseovarius faecimaris TaxID=2494550 RepID=A0A6I6ITI2_9RHOB|nr:methylated-DNA--[protein]-cysteine S-methyltransferase [Roseovarius faecimaris]QGY00420.1 methylated-DNA--[protein]-cysteine S-methyltransferase [Roseovarius faecimaris]